MMVRHRPEADPVSNNPGEACNWRAYWYADSGDSNHMTPHLADFTKFNPAKRGAVDIADNSQMAHEGEGEVELAVLNSEGEEIEVTLKGVLYSPSLATRLFSEEYSSQRGAVLIGSKDHFSVLILEDDIEIPLVTSPNGGFSNPISSFTLYHPPALTR